MRTSPLYSLKDELDYVPRELNAFELLGLSSMGVAHIVIYYKKSLGPLIVDLEGSVKVSKNCTVCALVNSRGTSYGMLFVVNQNSFRIINKTRLYVVGTKKLKGDFSIYPFSNDKSALSMYKDSADHVLANIGKVNSRFVVLDE